MREKKHFSNTLVMHGHRVIKINDTLMCKAVLPAVRFTICLCNEFLQHFTIWLCCECLQPMCLQMNEDVYLHVFFFSCSALSSVYLCNVKPYKIQKTDR